ncbi:ADP-ribose pyrophosphatase YjhB, NUDIX family [Promicromonospora umidemergens]|uniref:Nudix hydrolase domain-containing protein n=2 Tax=Promicromonospora TaxID=43676 RepID=A0ABP8Y4B5_9MICO|nr:NUDIX domain-containing protein [Promicromonospora umidemergens]MCP2286792.1 ADP-ribose pyrophosphatase YjhB, NUDIX family [Promicromonospora umidemergens]
MGGWAVRNEQLRTQRKATSSPSGSGQAMSRAELAAAVNEYVRVKTGRSGGLRGSEIGRYERGEVRWPSKLYREALRKILKARSDQELGFFPTPRGLSPHEARARAAITQGSLPPPPAATPGSHLAGVQVIAQALIRNDRKFLVVDDQGLGWSHLPGGSIDGQPVHSTLLRHVAEQTGLVATIAGFAGVVDHHHSRTGEVHSVITLVFEAHVDITAADRDELRPGVEWLALAELAERDVRPAALKDALLSGADGSFWRPWTI